MKTLIKIGFCIDILVSFALHIAGIVKIVRGEWVSAAVILGMASIWQIGCHGIKIRKE